MKITLCYAAGLILSLLWLCSCESGSSFRLQGHLPEEAEGKKLFLVKTVPGGSSSRVDSAVVARGKFSIKNSGVDEGVYYLTFDSEPFVIFYLQNEDTEIEMEDWWNPEQISVTGGPLTLLFQSFMNDFHQQSVRSEEDQTAFCKDFVEKHLNTPVGVYILYAYLTPRLSEDQLFALSAKIDTSLRENEYVRILQTYVRAEQRIAKGSSYSGFEAFDAQGNLHRLQEVCGHEKILLLSFWASWCVPCRENLQNVKALYAQYRHRNFEVLGLSIDNAREAWTTALQEESADFPMWRDTTRVAAQLYQVKDLPHFVLFSGEGKVVARGTDWEEIGKALSELIGE